MDDTSYIKQGESAAAIAEYPVLDSVQKVLNQLGELRYAPREHVMCFYLDTRLQMLVKETVAIGSVNQAGVRPRDIFSVIKYHPVSFLIVAHNHPSGIVTPSPEDILFTKNLVQAGILLGVEVLDHVIVGREAHYSLRAHEQLGSQ